jgi:hypothetical protein
MLELLLYKTNNNTHIKISSDETAKHFVDTLLANIDLDELNKLLSGCLTK